MSKMDEKSDMESYVSRIRQREPKHVVSVEDKVTMLEEYIYV